MYRAKSTENRRFVNEFPTTWNTALVACYRPPSGHRQTHSGVIRRAVCSNESATNES